MTHDEVKLLREATRKFSHPGHRVHLLMHPDDKPYFDAIMQAITRSPTPLPDDTMSKVQVICANFLMQMGSAMDGNYRELMSIVPDRAIKEFAGAIAAIASPTGRG